MHIMTREMRQWLLSLMLWVAAIPLVAQQNTKPFTIPELTEWQGSTGVLVPSGRVVTSVKTAEAKNHVARFVAEQPLLKRNQSLTLARGKARPGDIEFRMVNDPTLGEEGYRLQVTDRVLVEASTAQGLLWGTRTLQQLLEQSHELPCGTAVDVPQYACRGFMIDVGRKYIPMSYLKDLVKSMSYYKMNLLQIHLNDNAFKQYFGNDWEKTPGAFRLECDTYPGLTARDGSYTKAEFIELQKLAEAYGVEILPEIDVPAHSLAFTHYRKSLGSPEYGMDHLDLFNPETIPFVDGLLKEYLEGKEPVFRGPRVHVGTDEYSNAKQEVVEKFREFTNHMIETVESYGKQAVVWGALTHANGQTRVKSDNVIMDIWYNGYADPVEMKKQGYKLICIPDGWIYIVPAAGYYYDYLNCEKLYQKWTPAMIGHVKFDEQDPSIWGGMFAVWNDHAGNGISVRDIHDRVFPAMQTLSTKCWTGQKTAIPYATFDQHRRLLSEAPGVYELGLQLTSGQRIAPFGATPQAGAACLPEWTTRSQYGLSYHHAVEFEIDCAAEEKGTLLASDGVTRFYLSDPRDGKLGFEREHYLNSFKYSLPTSGRVKIRIECTPRETRLLVDGKLKETLGPQTLHVITPAQQVDYVYGDVADPRPQVYREGAKMYYQRTLAFPLQQLGTFQSQLKSFTIERLPE